MEQINLFGGTEPINITKKIRLIETFAGIGAQAKALENIGADFEHYRICEFDKYAVTAYNAIHGTDFLVSDITKWTAADMGIEEKDKYEYIVTYSFPCQSLSVAGKCAGMAKGSGTRSGLLWEVERLLEECNGNLPQLLLMENVDAILFEKNRKHFFQWCNRLEEFGYKNYYQILNAKNYGIPQNRNRCFMVSVLGNYYYEFPQPIKLELRVKDLLEKEVPEKYYISSKAVEGLLRAEATKGHKPAWLDKDGTAPAIDTKVGDTTHWSPYIKDKVCIPCLTPARIEKRQNGRRFKEDGEEMFTLTTQDIHGVMIGADDEIMQVGQLKDTDSFGGNPQIGRVYSTDHICPAINTMQGGQREPKFLIEEETFIGKKYKQFIKENGYIPEMFNPYNIQEITDITPAQTANCGGTGCSATVLITEDSCGDKYIIESKPAFGRAGKQACEALNENKCCEGDTINPFNKTVDKSGTSPSLTTRPEGFKTAIFPVEKTQLGNFRIRKLLPIECYLLMGFTREDFFKVKKVGVSDCQCYKQAGNSIAVPCLEAIFRNMNMKGIDRWDK